MAMDAILAMIADGEQVIIVIEREGVEINYFIFSCISLIQLKPSDGGLIQLGAVVITIIKKKSKIKILK